MKQPNRMNHIVLMSQLALCLGLGLSCKQQTPDAAEIELKGETFAVELAHTRQARAQGLMYRQDLPAHHGMLFIFVEDKPRSFYMKNCLIDLDIIFFQGDGLIVNITTMKVPVPGESLPLYPSGAPVRYALELRGGTCARLGLALGDRIQAPEVVRRIKPEADL